MTEGLVKVLRPEGDLEKGQETLPISAEDLLRLYRVMLLNRRLDERMIKLQRQGRIGFYVGSIGEEAAILGSAFALQPQDWIVPCYRELGAALLRGFTIYELCCQLFGNSDDRIKGRQMPNHYAASELRFGSISSPVGNQIPYATGLGLASRISGGDDVTLVYFGDGATSTGDFHVGLNFAGVFKASTIFLCRNNQWAISAPVEIQTASSSIAIKAQAYGIEGVQVDGNDILAVYTTTRQAAERARQGKGPTLIEAVTYRQGAHSTSDDPRVYRAEAEVEEWKKKDPLIRLRTYLIKNQLWSDAKDSDLEDTIKQEIDEALHRAEQLGPPALDSMFEDVLDTIPWHLEEQRAELRKAIENRGTSRET